MQSQLYNRAEHIMTNWKTMYCACDWWEKIRLWKSKFCQKWLHWREFQINCNRTSIHTYWVSARAIKWPKCLTAPKKFELQGLHVYCYRDRVLVWQFPFNGPVHKARNSIRENMNFLPIAVSYPCRTRKTKKLYRQIGNLFYLPYIAEYVFVLVSKCELFAPDGLQTKQ